MWMMLISIFRYDLCPCLSHLVFVLVLLWNLLPISFMGTGAFSWYITCSYLFLGPPGKEFKSQSCVANSLYVHAL
uniref:Uncharacterized protein n=1 Tax=Arundo donax TaxID=35708 RepID=A0A0A9EUC7_ARUDO